MPKIVPVIVLLIAGFFLLGGNLDLKLDNIFPTPVNPAVVVVDRNPTEEMKAFVAPVVTVVQQSNASKENKKVAAAAWFGASDVWKQMGDVNFTTDKVEVYNRELLTILNNNYPQLANSFPGFNNALTSSFFAAVGSDPKPVTPEVKKRISDWSEAVGWAFTQ